MPSYLCGGTVVSMTAARLAFAVFFFNTNIDPAGVALYRSELADWRTMRSVLPGEGPAARHDIEVW